MGTGGFRATIANRWEVSVVGGMGTGGGQVGSGVGRATGDGTRQQM